MEITSLYLRMFVELLQKRPVLCEDEKKVGQGRLRGLIAFG